MENCTCPASRKNGHRKRYGILYLTMVYNIGMPAIHFTYLSTVVHIQSSMHRQPCVVTYTVTVTVCVTMVRYGALRTETKTKTKTETKTKEVGVVTGRVSQLVSFLKTTDRGHKYKLYKKSTNTRVRSEFFSERAITAWNGLATGTDFRSFARFKNCILATDFTAHLKCF